MRRRVILLSGLAVAIAAPLLAGCGEKVDETAPTTFEDKNKFEKSTGVPTAPADDAKQTAKTD